MLPTPEGSMLNPEQQRGLLRMARETLERFVLEGVIPLAGAGDSVLAEKKGVFVTLTRRGNLRGCIGTVTPAEPLYLAVCHKTVDSAARDPRFPPVTGEELRDIEIEISVLEPPRRVRCLDEIELGKHGVIVQKGERAGLFLPQVAKDSGWNLEKLLSVLCVQKAGLPEDSWRDKETEIFTFTTQSFGERDFKKCSREP